MDPRAPTSYTIQACQFECSVITTLAFGDPNYALPWRDQDMGDYNASMTLARVDAAIVLALNNVGATSTPISGSTATDFSNYVLSASEQSWARDLVLAEDFVDYFQTNTVTWNN